MSYVVKYSQWGGPSVLRVEQENAHAPGAGEVLIRQEAIGVNFVDTMFRDGTFKAGLPGVAGVEGAGMVDAVGSGVTRFAPGDRVAYFFAPGSYATERVVSEDVLVKLPDNVQAETAATILTKGLTAWMAISAMAKPDDGDRVLVQGATGGVGNLLSRWLRKRGITVIGTGSHRKQAGLEKAVDHAFAYGTVALDEHIRTIALYGVDIVYELVGAATFATTLGVIRDGGTIAVIGAASGGAAIDEGSLHRRGIRLVRASTGQHVTKDNLQAAADEVFDAWRNGVFGTASARKYPLWEAQRAHADILERRSNGPMVLVP
ncbi:Zn-dependent oxidoreductase, NADPH:quinone reductase [Rhizobium sp. CF122]|uniref:alcohol dehydrogenase catalytic domain-containing protein n=1 Tax=Rhizobium sp. CF122 TaxID=1144312 RepID=UPI000271B12E|nr:zinc-binding dehydrogenase [Rhizobium sp. CF122]EJL57896.1 Zn-dependent oxidoreductase, NADPH:quinone reductase [Rhizobium sp. CF122]